MRNCVSVNPSYKVCYLPSVAVTESVTEGSNFIGTVWTCHGHATNSRSKVTYGAGVWGGARENASQNELSNVEKGTITNST